MAAESSRRWAERWLRGEEHGVAATALSLLLLPAEAAFRLASGLRNLGYDTGVRRIRRARVPVVSVGNVAVGGAGKTPVTAWIVDLLTARGRRPAVLHGGYADDEPALHRLWHPDVPVLAQRDRVAAADHAVDQLGADVLVLDDAFQHRRLARDLDLVLVAAEDWTGRPRLLPRGPWREPPRALRRAHVVAVTRKTASPERSGRIAAELARRSGRPIMRIALHPAGWAHVGGAAGRPDTTASPPTDALAVTAIAAPERFFENARQAGAVIRRTLTFPDHHAYSPGDVARIVELAAGGPVVTTEKDAVKLVRLNGNLDFRVLKQAVVVEEGLELLEARLDEVLS